MLFKRIDKKLKDKIVSLGKWYYYINFDGIEVRRDLKRDKTNGFNNWDNYLKYCIAEVGGRRILDVGCNAGIYDLEMAKMGAREIIGIDLDIRQALFVEDFFSKKSRISFDNVKFIERDASEEGLQDLGRFDFACLFCTVYHFEKRIDFVMEEISRITDSVVLQGNLKRLNSPKYKDRMGTEYAGIDGMRQLLQRHELGKIHIFALNDYPKPVVIGER